MAATVAVSSVVCDGRNLPMGSGCAYRGTTYGEQTDKLFSSALVVSAGVGYMVVFFSLTCWEHVVRVLMLASNCDALQFIRDFYDIFDVG